MDTEVIIYILSFAQLIVVSWSTWVTNQVFILRQEIALNNKGDEEVKVFMQDVSLQLKAISEHLVSIELSLAKNGIDVEKK